MDFELQRDDWHILTEDQINARFNGLLEVSKASDSDSSFKQSAFTFTYRSIVELLQNDSSKKELQYGIDKDRALVVVQYASWAASSGLPGVHIAYEITVNINGQRVSKFSEDIA
ncbi:hypothetical protein F4774DRAFT_359788 [Daldinia eschscholtzii]|nr:hypothetical protein F4774DRAFT_359788 [Daldinia eschscholtzii]